MIQRKAQLGDQVMIFPFLFIMILIGGGIVGGTLLFFGNEYDVRQSEANTLAYTLQTCIQQHTFNWESADIDSEIYKTCHLDGSALSEGSLIRLKRNSVQILTVNIGKVEGCFFIGATKNPAYPKCTTLRFSKDGTSYELTTGSFQRKQRVTG